LAISTRARTTFLLHLAQRRISRHDFRSPIGVAGVGRAVYGNSGISFGQPQWRRSDDYQTRQSQSVHKLFGADGRETQLDVPRKSSGSGDGVTKNSGDLCVGQFVMGYLERHGRDDNRTDKREQDRNIERMLLRNGPADQRAHHRRLTLTQPNAQKALLEPLERCRLPFQPLDFRLDRRRQHWARTIPSKLSELVF
jgi:hypothetical protein